MKLHTCTTCHQPVAEHEAYIRSIVFRLAFWCRPCWEGIPAPRIPAPRTELQRRLAAVGSAS